MSIHKARMGTRINQVVDIFLTTAPSENILDATHGEQIQATIQQAVNDVLDEGH